MHASLMVPLDRSPVAELALPFAVVIAQRTEAALELVTVHRSYMRDNPHATSAWALKLARKREAKAKAQQEEEDHLLDAGKRTKISKPSQPSFHRGQRRSAAATRMALTALQLACQFKIGWHLDKHSEPFDANGLANEQKSRRH